MCLIRYVKEAPKRKVGKQLTGENMEVSGNPERGGKDLKMTLGERNVEKEKVCERKM